jgi:hypothetical protein
VTVPNPQSRPQSPAFLVAPADYQTTIGPIDADYANLHSLRIVSADFSGGINCATTEAPFANIVVPTGTEFELTGDLGGDEGSPQYIDVTNESFLGDDLMGDTASLSVIGPSESSLPEPTSIGVFAIFGSGLLLRRRRQG